MGFYAWQKDVAGVWHPVSFGVTHDVCLSILRQQAGENLGEYRILPAGLHPGALPVECEGCTDA